MNEHLALLWLEREQRERYFLMQNRLRNAWYTQYFSYPYSLCRDYSGITASVADLKDVLFQSYIRPFSLHLVPLPVDADVSPFDGQLGQWDSVPRYLHVTLNLPCLQPMGKCLSHSVCRGMDVGEEIVMLCIDTGA